jgi:Ethylbenzene dehydrogenase
MKNRLSPCIAAACGFAAMGSGAALAADLEKIDWSAVPKSEIVLFYPGQSSHEWLLSANHNGNSAVKDGKNCLECHKGEEAEIGKIIASGKKLEPKPIPEFPGSIKLTLQAAYDKESLYLRASWPAKKAGIFHEYAIYKDGKWEEPYGSHRGNDLVREGKTPPSYEDRFSIMLGDSKSVPAFNSEGCWIACHNDMRFMPNAAKKEDVEAHPILGKGGMKKSDIRKYISESHTAMGDTGGWDKIKTKEELEALKAKGVFLDLWQWRANRSAPVKMADDGYVLEYRNSDAGKAVFVDIWDKEKHQSKFMLDPAKNNGKAAWTKADFQNPEKYALIDKDAVPYDPNYKFKDGDLLPVFMTVAKPEGSAADNNPVIGAHANGMWTVLWKRRLNTGNSSDDVILKPGESYPVGLAVHDDMTTARWHYVSFPLKLTIGGKDGHINAVELK